MTAKRSIQEQQRIGAPRGAESGHLPASHTSLFLIALLTLPSGFVTSDALAQSTLPGAANAITGGSDLGGSAKGLLNIGAKPNVSTKAVGVSANELLRGNGSRIGYALQHGNVLPDTVSVRVGGSLLKLNRDYWLDADSGALYFAQAVRSSDSVSIYYRYLDGADAPKKLQGVSGLQLNLGSSSQLGLAFDLSGASGSLYGLSLNSKFGAGQTSSYGGLVYFSKKQQAAAAVALGQPPPTTPPAGQSPAGEGVDHFISQNLNLQAGGLRFHADYQDVGKDFSGFQALKAGNANNKALLDQLTLMEGEKGIKRTGFGFSTTPNAKTKTPTGLAFDMNQIQDGKGTIKQETLGFTGHNFHLNYATRDVSENFAQFTGLREADKAQWAHEKGLRTTNLGFGMNFGNGGKKGSTPGILDFSEQSFGDKSGKLQRQTLSVNSGNFGFQMLDRKADKDFKRIADLSDADKTALALDLYRQFDPKAKPEQVTAADKAQVLKEAGFTRSGLRADMNWGKGGGLAFSQFHVADAPKDDKSVTSSLQRESLTLDTRRLSLAYTQRRMDTAFTRIADLSDVERNYLALDIRRQFDPDAKLEQLTPKERDQLVKESGLERAAMRGKFQVGKGSQFVYSQFSLQGTEHKAPEDNGVHRQTLAFTAKNLQFSLLNQSIASGFTRLADLNDVEKAQFANEQGLTRQQRGLLWQVNKYTKLSYNSIRYGGTEDNIAAAMAAAQKDSKDPQAAAKAAASGLARKSVTLETKGFSLAANQSDTGKGFSRAADLALPAADKAIIEAERGFKRKDVTTKLTSIRGLTLDGFFFNADNAENKLRHDTHRVNAQFVSGKRTTLTYLNESDMAGETDKLNGTAHKLMTLTQQFGKIFLLNLLHESSATQVKGEETAAVRTDLLHLETPKEKPNNLMFEKKQVELKDNRYENTTNLNVHVKPNKQFSFAYSRSEIERGDTNEVVNPDAEKDPAKKEVSEKTESFDLQWQATKKFAVILGTSQHDATDRSDSDTVTIGLQGDPVRNFTLTAKFDEVHNTTNTKDVADFALSNTKPLCFGPIKDLTIKAGYASLNDQRKLQNETMTGHANWKIWKNEFILDYGGLTKTDGTSTISRLYSFTTDPNPKKAFHGGFIYKVRTMADGEDKLIRRFTADWRLSKKTNFVYTYGTLPEDDKGNITPLETADISLKHSFRPDQSFQLFYRLSDNTGTKVLTRSFGFGYEGKLSSNTKFAVSYSKDMNGLGDKYDRADHLHFLFDQQVNADHFFTLGVDLRSHDSVGLTNEIQTNLDFRTRF